MVIGAGAVGFPAAIQRKKPAPLSCCWKPRNDVGGHAITSGGNVPLGGGTSAQKKHNIKDSAELLFADLTDWSVVQPNGFPDYRYNDKEIIRAFVDNNVSTSIGCKPTESSLLTRPRMSGVEDLWETPSRGRCTALPWRGHRSRTVNQ